MNLTSPSQVKALLDELEIEPRKTWGQNFLIDRNILNIIRSVADLRHEDVSLEIGPGLGILTDELAGLTRKVIAIEKDPILCDYLRDHFQEQPHVEIIEGDALDISLQTILAQGVTKMVSNLPYASGTRILLEIVQSSSRPGRMVVMLQRDVAERLAADPNNKHYGFISVATQMFYDVSLEKHVSPHCFLPAPEIQSSIVRLERRNIPEELERAAAGVRKLAKWMFTHRRKQLSTLLRHPPAEQDIDPAKASSWLTAAGIDPKARPENVTVEQWIKLAEESGH